MTYLYMTDEDCRAFVCIAVEYPKKWKALAMAKETMADSLRHKTKNKKQITITELSDDNRPR